jgi:hypothetical protein
VIASVTSSRAAGGGVMNVLGFWVFVIGGLFDLSLCRLTVVSLDIMYLEKVINYVR